jgi:ABC-type multidrug transport system fused ATPase/permease subunit
MRVLRHLSAAGPLAVTGLSSWLVDRYLHHVEGLFGPINRQQDRLVRQQWQQFVVVALPLALVFPVVAVSAASGHTTVAVVTAVLAAGQAMYQGVGGVEGDLFGALACLEAWEELRQRLVGTADQTLDPAPKPGEAVCEDQLPAVRIEGLHFGYPGASRPVLQGLDLEIRPGELLAVVGLNGAGKSTLIKVLAGLYTPSSGRITVNGVDVNELGLARWREMLGIVFQDFVKYELSAADNVALGHATVPRDEQAIAAAAKDVGFDAIIEDLPAGWETPLARSRTGGVDLSGGQWQQLVLARSRYAVRTGAKLLVLDEPTAHLDVRTEFQVFNQLARRRGEASIVLIINA